MKLPVPLTAAVLRAVTNRGMARSPEATDPDTGIKKLAGVTTLRLTWRRVSEGTNGRE